MLWTFKAFLLLIEHIIEDLERIHMKIILIFMNEILRNSIKFILKKQIIMSDQSVVIFTNDTSTFPSHGIDRNIAARLGLFILLMITSNKGRAVY